MCLTFLILTILTSASLANPEEVSKKPNIIFIMADDLGAGMLGHNGQKIVTTPHIDKLAAEGMSFSNCYGNPYFQRSAQFSKSGHKKVGIQISIL